MSNTIKSSLAAQSTEVPVTIVTGGNGGLGLEISLELARRGHYVVACGLAAAQVSSTAQGFENLHRALVKEGLNARVLAVEADITEPEQAQQVVEQAKERFGRISALVNNAAIGPLGTIVDTPKDLFMRVLEVNIAGAYQMSRLTLPHFIEQGGGSIINVGSGAAYGKAGMAAYSASKGGLLALTMAMAYDHFHERVRVNMVIPGGGGIVTGMSAGRFGGDIHKFLNRPILGSVAGRAVNGVDLAATADFLISRDAEAITGTVIDVGSFAHQGGPVPPKAS